MDTRASNNGIKGLNLEQLGIPSEAELLETYAGSANCNEVPDIDYYIVFSMFRLAAILAGVLKRGIEGNAADPRAIERGRTYQPLSRSALAIATGLD